jgi:hypothetical protein
MRKVAARANLYSGSAHRSDISTMAATLGQVAGSASDLARVTEGRASIWWGLVDGWI